ncbi:MAG: holo-ACP synthase, malonate decarboxylase-specific [Gammaproteobacteria bacterium]|nr:holo-ACP synthase, malonate decarboxylase-specific [Gammaproteobacteria bacterium]
MPARIHDLLEIDAERFLQAHSSVPAWVAETLRQTPFVVVRRGPVSDQEISIGVRGAHRNERWAGGCHPSHVKEALTPQRLLGRAAELTMAAATTSVPPHAPAALAPPATVLSRADSIPALRTLSLLAQRWKALDSVWGPGGSVGFELATGRRIVTPQSDLDVVIYANERMTVNEARLLRDSTQGLPSPVDIRVETPICGFSLVEYASRAPAPILLRTASGAALGADPWGT